MGTTVDKLNGLKNTKQAIKQAIIDKGVAVDEAATFASYASKIGEITTGGGGEKGFLGITEYPDKKFTAIERCGWLYPQIKSIDWAEFNKLGITDMNNMFNGWKGKTLDISNLSTTGVTNTNGMFYGCENLTSLDASHFDTSQVTEMSNMFYGCENLTSLNVSHFDTSQVTSMYDMFYQNFNLTSLDLSSWDTSRVTNMGGMFFQNSKLQEIKGIENFNTENTTSMSSMFSGCRNLTSLDLRKWNTSKVTSLSRTFSGCSKLQEIKGIGNFNTSNVKSIGGTFEEMHLLTSLDLSKWDTTNVTETSFWSSNLLSDCPNLVTVIWGSNWLPNPKVTSFNISTGLYNVTTNKLSKASVLDLLNKLAQRDNAPTLSIPGNMYDQLTPEEIKIAQDKGWTVTRV